MVWRPAQPKTPDRPRIETPPLQICTGAAAFGPPQAGFVKRCCGFGRLEQCLLPLRPLALLRGRLGHRQSGLFGQLFDSLDEIEVVGPHDKPDRIAMRTAAEAMKKGLVLDNVEGGGFFMMERAQPGKLAPAADELDLARDQ